MPIPAGSKNPGGARTLACSAGTHADGGWPGRGGVELRLEAARKSACATSAGHPANQFFMKFHGRRWPVPPYRRRLPVRANCAFRWLVDKEWRALMASKAWWILLLVMGPLVGISFIDRNSV